MITTPLLLDLPLPIYTSRLLIRPMMPGDGQNIFEAVEETRTLLSPWLPWVNEVKQYQDSEKTARQFYANFILRKDFNFCIFKANQFIGCCSLHSPNWDIPSVSIGYWCRQSAQGQGYITEAIGTLIVYAFQEIKFKKVSIFCEDDNTKSIAIAKRLGFNLETKAKGLIANPYFKDLRTAHHYVRFNNQGLEKNYSYSFNL